MRTCVGCREIVPKGTLARLTLAPGTEHDVAFVLGAGPGRGAYVHRRAACITAATRGGLARSLRRAIPGAAVRGLAADLSPTDDNPSQNRAGLEGQSAVETRLGSVANEEG